MKRMAMKTPFFPQIFLLLVLLFNQNSAISQTWDEVIKLTASDAEELTGEKFRIESGELDTGLSVLSVCNEDANELFSAKRLVE